jgi:hypothetical protein
MDELTEKDLLYVLDSVQAIDYNEERSDKELEILREMGYFEHAESLLLEAGIPTADVKEGLDENQFYQLKTLFNIPPDLRYVAPESKIPAIATLNSIADQSKQLRYPAKAENMKAKWAKEYYSGYYAQYKTQVNKALESGESAASTGAGEFDREGRPYYYVRCAFCLLVFSLHLEQKLFADTNDRGLENRSLWFHHRRMLGEATQCPRQICI